MMGLKRGLEVTFDTLPLLRRQMGCVLEPVLRGLCERGHGAATLQELLFGLAHQRHEDFALPAALPTKAAPDLLEVVVERVSLALQRGRLRGPLGRNALDEVEDFF
jgi:hypothetical protein